MITSGNVLKGLMVGIGSLVVSYNLLLPAEAPPLTPQAYQAPPPLPEWRLHDPEHAPFDRESSFEPDLSLRNLEPPASGMQPSWASQAEPENTLSGSWRNSVLSPQEQTIFQRMNVRRGEPLMTPEEFLQALYTPSAILPLPDEARPISYFSQLGQAQEEIRFHRGKLETLFPGDEMYLYSHQLGQALIMKVDRIQDHRDGSLTWHGHLKDVTGHFPISFTQGPQFTLAHLETPWGDFQLNVQGEQGWLVREGGQAMSQRIPSPAAVHLSRVRSDW